MSAPKKPVNLKHSEIEHLLHLIEVRRREGWYTGVKSKFEAREQSIHAKLEIAAKTKTASRDHVAEDGEA
jgi:hypothetical protein